MGYGVHQLPPCSNKGGKGGTGLVLGGWHTSEREGEREREREIQQLALLRLTTICSWLPKQSYHARAEFGSARVHNYMPTDNRKKPQAL